MISPSLTTMLVFSIASALMGLWLLRVALGGKLISPHPHCRKCKIDLLGLDLTNPTPCPECGITLRTNTPAITDGLKKKRKLVLLISILFLLTAATGLAWPTLSKLPSIQNINIYDHFPETLLIRLATTGDDSAFQALHDRLIPGKLSTPALHKLTKQAFAQQADESADWDTRWGDILLYAFMSETMTTEQVHGYLENAFAFEVVMHNQVEQSRTELKYMFNSSSAARGGSSPQFRNQWANSTNALIPFSMTDTTLQYQSHTFPAYRAEEPEPERWSGGGRRYDPNRPGWWVPYDFIGGGVGTQINLPEDEDKIEYIFKYTVSVYRENALLHEWTGRIPKIIRRVKNPEYVKTIDKPSAELRKLIAGLIFSPFTVPTQIQEAKKHQNIRSGHSTNGTLRSTAGSPHGLMGQLWLVNGEDEVFFSEIKMQLKENHGYGFNGPSGFGTGKKSWLYFYEKNAEFWSDVVERGSIDVVYLPDPSLARDYAQVKTMINFPIIFRDVPLIIHVPKLKSIQQGRNGPVVDTWTMSPINEPEVGVGYSSREYNARFGRPESVHGEVLDKE